MDKIKMCNLGVKGGVVRVGILQQLLIEQLRAILNS
jgi:hypothetical protein